jgi:hypothetical protein
MPTHDELQQPPTLVTEVHVALVENPSFVNDFIWQEKMHGVHAVFPEPGYRAEGRDALERILIEVLGRCVRVVAVEFRAHRSLVYYTEEGA